MFAFTDARCALSPASSDVITYASADADDRLMMDAGCHYDYTAQTWRDGHDHAHFTHDDGPLHFCGADAATCRRGNPAQWGEVSA